MHFHADDFGLTKKTNSVIGKMLNESKLKSVSVIVTTEAFKSIAPTLSTLKVPVFLHFSLTEGTPISGPESIASILRPGGGFYNQQQLMKRCILRKVSKGDVWRELEAQMDVLLKTGVNVAGIDTHQHLHAFNPISAAVFEYANERTIEFVRSYSQVRVAHFSTNIVKFGYRLLSRATSLGQSPRSWREKKWRPFMMATWEKITSTDEHTVVVVHPGTDFDCQESLFKQIIRHFRYTKHS